MSAKSRTAYLVERAAFTAGEFGDSPCLYPSEGEEGPSYTPVRAFADYEAADALAAEMTAEARATLPPALFVAYELPGGRDGVAALARRLGLSPPRFSDRSYEHGDEFRAWWAAHAGDITPEARAAVWDQMEDVPFYRVREITVED